MNLSTNSLTGKTCAVLGKLIAADHTFAEYKFADCMLGEDGKCSFFICFVCLICVTHLQCDSVINFYDMNILISRLFGSSFSVYLRHEAPHNVKYDAETL